MANDELDNSIPDPSDIVLASLEGQAQTQQVERLPMTLLLSCLRCSHSWLRRSLTSEPKFCPRCHSPYWSKARQQRVWAKRKAAARGNPRTSEQIQGA